MQAEFLPKICHFQNSWLLPRAQVQASSETASEMVPLCFKRKRKKISVLKF